MIKRLVKKTIQFIEFISNTSIEIKRGARIKVDVNLNAVSDGTAMQRYVELTRMFCNFVPENIFEIGANYAQDADYLRKSFSINEGSVYVFEPHPQIFKAIKDKYNFKSFDVAVSNLKGNMRFHAIDIEKNEYKNSGISSLRKGLTKDGKNFFDVDVKVIRMDDFIVAQGIKSIDFLKIDVEGVNYEVLEGFGEYLSIVKSIQIEGEYKEYWEGQKLYKDIECLLSNSGFLLVDFQLSHDGVQSDSFWVRKNLIKSDG